MNKREVLPPPVEAPALPAAPATEMPTVIVDSNSDPQNQIVVTEHSQLKPQPLIDHQSQPNPISLREGVTSLRSAWRQGGSLNHRRKCFNRIKSQYQHEKLEDFLI